MNGTKQIIYPDGQQRIIKSDRSEEIFSVDGSVHSILPDGVEKINFKNGNVVTVTKNFTVKQNLFLKEI